MRKLTIILILFSLTGFSQGINKVVKFVSLQADTFKITKAVVDTSTRVCVFGPGNKIRYNSSISGTSSAGDTTWTDNGFAAKKQTSKRDTVVAPVFYVTDMIQLPTGSITGDTEDTILSIVNTPDAAGQYQGLLLTQIQKHALLISNGVIAQGWVGADTNKVMFVTQGKTAALDSNAFFPDMGLGFYRLNLGKPLFPWDTAFFKHLILDSLSGSGSILGVDANGNVVKTTGTSDSSWTRDYTSNRHWLYPKSTNDSVGIGKTPTVRLDVNGTVKGTSTNGAGISGTSTNSYGVYGASTSGYAGYFVGGGTYANYVNNTSTATNVTGTLGYAENGRGIYGLTTAGIGLYGVATSGTGLYATSSSGYAGIFAAGNVGIGTTAPTALLHVNGAIKQTGTDTTGVGSTANVGTMMYYNGHFYGLIPGTPPTWKQLDN